jgi:hypothetical protein
MGAHGGDGVGWARSEEEKENSTRSVLSLENIFLFQFFYKMHIHLNRNLI